MEIGEAKIFLDKMDFLELQVRSQKKNYIQLKQAGVFKSENNNIWFQKNNDKVMI